MFEFEQFDPALIGSVQHPALDPESDQRFGSNRIQSFSLMSWGEHCTECAFPSCYTTCSFYEPRPDGRCRRFKFGIYRAASPHTWMSYSAYVEFKNWSQLWAQGNATQLPPSLSRAIQKLFAFGWTVTRPGDALLVKTTGRKRLSLGLQAARRRMFRWIGGYFHRFPKPDCLLIEIFNPMTVELQLYLRIKGDAPAARFEWAERARPGFSSFAIPIAEVERAINLSLPFELALTVREEEGKRFYLCSAAFVRQATKPALSPVAGRTAVGVNGKKIKCVVWDLDHTLWDGILLEGQAGEFRLKDGIRSVLTELDRRGILLSVASKNNEEDARRVLQTLGVWELFLAPQIGWQPKSASLKEIAARLNLGLDVFAFVDDAAFERDEVTAALPMVTALPADKALTLLERPEFAGDASGDGAGRRRRYQVELRREQAQADAGLGYDAFLATCGIQVRVQRPSEALLPRIYDIVQRTNQLNFTTARYDMDQLRGLLHDPERHCYIVECSDKYGDYGHIGFVVIALAGEAMEIRDCMFSCRVQGKRIDEAVLVYLVNHYLSSGLTNVSARFKPTNRNAPAGEMLARVGFVKGANSEGKLVLTPATPRATVPHVNLAGEFAPVAGGGLVRAAASNPSDHDCPANPQQPATDAPRKLTELVTSVFQSWREAGVAFLVLRNYQGLPEKVGNDLDVMVRRTQLETAESILLRTAERLGFRRHNRVEFSPISIFLHHPGSLAQIQIDLFFSQQWRGFDFLSADAMLDRRVDRGLYAIPHPVHEAVTDLLSRLIFHGYVKENYKQFILDTTRARPAEMKETLAQVFGEKLAGRIVAAVVAEQWPEIEAAFGAMRRQLMFRQLFHHPWRALTSRGRDYRRFFGRLVRPPGLTVALIGPDGCGKSSVAEKLQENMTHTFRPDKSLRVHWKPAVFLKQRRAARPPTTDPHGSPPRNALLSLAYLGYHWLEYFLGGWLHFLPVRFRNGLVLIDRYYYDFAVDARRYRLRVSPALVKFLFRFVPQPDLVFLLDAPADVLQARKAEVPRAETERQRQAYRELLARLPNARIINGHQPLDQVVAEIAGHLLAFMHDRQRQWSGNKDQA